MQVREYQTGDKLKWDEFVDSMHQGSLFHKIAWKNIIDVTFGYTPVYLLAEEGGAIKGILPLYHVRSLFAGNALISIPFAVYGGILAANTEAESSLFQAARRFATQYRAGYIEFHQRFPCDNQLLQTRDDLYCTFIKPITSSPEQNFQSLPREARRLVRVGIKNELVARFGNDQVNQFYDIYAVSVRNLGTPVFPKRLFINCLQEFGSEVDLLVVYHNNTPVAGVISFYYRDTVMPYYGGSTPQAKQLSPNNFMYWKLLEHALEKKCSFFDFGRSKTDTGVFNFKRNMGFEPTPLPYQYYLANGKSLPNNNPTNPRYQIAISLWQRLPLGVTRFLGPRLVRYFP